MLFKKIHPYKKDIINAIIETPRNSQNKFAYDPELKVFKLTKVLPLGTVFPFDFGFVPNTIGEDGDPIDILVIMDAPAYPGCLVECRPIGVLEALQKTPGGEEKRNDRIVAVCNFSVMYAGVRRLIELSAGLVEELEHFFIDYNKREGREFIPIKWNDGDAAFKLLRGNKVSV